MKAIPPTPEMLAVARRLVWFEAPEAALSDPVRFMAYAMARATHEDDGNTPPRLGRGLRRGA